MGNFVSFCAGFVAGDFVNFLQTNTQEGNSNREEYHQRADLALGPPENLAIAHNPAQQRNFPDAPGQILAIEQARGDHVQNENLRDNGAEDYENSREQWWANFNNPVHRSTRSQYRQVAANTSEERLYQVM